MAIEALKRLQEIKQRTMVCWIVAPKSTIIDTWAKHLEKLYPESNYSIYGQGCNHSNHALVVLFTPDLLHTRLDDLRFAPRPDIIIWDEITTLSGRGKRFKAAMILKKRHKPEYIWGMTGTPMADNPLGLYAQAAFVSNLPNFMPFFQWRSKTMMQISHYKWVPVHNWMDIVKQWLPPNIYVKTEDVYDQTMTSYQYKESELPLQIQNLQTRLRKTQMLQIGGMPVIPSNTAHLCSMLLQIAAGFVYTSEDSHVMLSDHRINAVLEYCRGFGHKALVYAPYTYLVDRLATGLGVQKIDGSVTKGRHLIFGAFRKSKQQFLVANPAAMSHGITLTEATEVIWVAPCYSNQTYQQANARIQRIGQEFPVTVTNFCSGNFEKGVYEVLKKKGDMQQYFLDYIGNR